MDIIIKQIIHDDYIFFYTDEAIKNNEIIGFYFDRLGIPQTIHKNSVYGTIIKEVVNKKNKTI